jgi:hypothetical protein
MWRKREERRIGWVMRAVGTMGMLVGIREVMGVMEGVVGIEMFEEEAKWRRENAV